NFGVPMRETRLPGNVVRAGIQPNEAVAGANGHREFTAGDLVKGHAGGAADGGEPGRATAFGQREDFVRFPSGNQRMGGAAAVTNQLAQTTSCFGVTD